MSQSLTSSPNRMAEFNIAEAARRNGRWLPNKTALIFEEERWTWRVVWGATQDASAKFLNAGVGVGDRVVVISRNQPELVFLYLACANIGAIYVPVNAWLRSSEIAGILEEVQPRVVLVSLERVDAWESVGTSGSLKWYLLDGALPERVEGDVRLSEWSSADATRTSDVRQEIDPLAPHLILYTSGATSKPKGAMISRLGTVLDSYHVAATWPISTSERFLTSTPLFPAAALGALNVMTLTGGTLVLMERFEARAALAQIREHKVTFILAFQTMLNGFQVAMEADDIPGFDLNLLLY